jgi:hypothetical protein
VGIPISAKRSRDQLYVSSYWKMGQSEDKHKIIKKQDAIAQDSV